MFMDHAWRRTPTHSNKSPEWLGWPKKEGRIKEFTVIVMIYRISLSKSWMEKNNQSAGSRINQYPLWLRAEYTNTRFGWEQNIPIPALAESRIYQYPLWLRAEYTNTRFGWEQNIPIPALAESRIYQYPLWLRAEYTNTRFGWAFSFSTDRTAVRGLTGLAVETTSSSFIYIISQNNDYIIIINVPTNNMLLGKFLG